MNCVEAQNWAIPIAATLIGILRIVVMNRVVDNAIPRMNTLHRLIGDPASALGPEMTGIHLIAGMEVE